MNASKMASEFLLADRSIDDLKECILHMAETLDDTYLRLKDLKRLSMAADKEYLEALSTKDDEIASLKRKLNRKRPVIVVEAKVEGV